MSIITVKSQSELDMIPLDTEDVIQIEFGTFCSPAIVRNCYKYRVVARDNSSVVARENSSVVARDNSSVEARDNSSVEARDNSSVEARDNSSVEAGGNVQVVNFLQTATIQISDNARTVYMPRNIEEYMNFYGIQHDKTTATFFKAVHKCNDEYVSDWDKDFKYIIGQCVKSVGFNSNEYDQCGNGIHISHRNWALDYGRNWEDFALLEMKVKIKDILLTKHSNGKVRVPKAEVIREVPLEECGLFGKILLQRHKRGDS